MPTLFDHPTRFIVPTDVLNLQAATDKKGTCGTSGVHFHETCNLAFATDKHVVAMRRADGTEELRGQTLRFCGIKAQELRKTAVEFVEYAPGRFKMLQNSGEAELLKESFPAALECFRSVMEKEGGFTVSFDPALLLKLANAITPKEDRSVTVTFFPCGEKGGVALVHGEEGVGILSLQAFKELPIEALRKLLFPEPK